MKSTKHSRYYGLMICFISSLFIYVNSMSQPNAVFHHVCDGICDVAWSPEGNLVAAVNQFGLWLYDVADHDSTPVLYPLKNVTSLDFNSTGEQIVVTSCSSATSEDNNCSGVISIFNLEDFSWQELFNFDFQVDDVQFSEDDQFIAVYQKKPSERGLRVIELETGDSVTMISGGMTNIITGYDFSEDGQYIAIGTENRFFEFGQFNAVSVWSVSTGNLIQSYSAEGLVADVNFISNEEIILLENDFLAGNVLSTTWDFVEDNISQNNISIGFIPYSDHIYEFVDGTIYIIGSLFSGVNFRERILVVWDLVSHEQVLNIEIHDQFTDVFSMNSTATFIANGSWVDFERQLDVWNLITGEHLEFILSVTLPKIEPVKSRVFQ